MANVADLNLIQINNFPEVESPEDWIVVSDASGTAYKISKENFKDFLGTVTVTAPKTIGPADGAPELDGVYIPTATQNEAGTPVVYPSFGGLEVNTAEGGDDYGTMVQFIKNGSVYAKVNTPMPQAINKIPDWTAGTYTIGQQANSNGQLWEVNVSSTNQEPGTGGDWVPKIDKVSKNQIDDLLKFGVSDPVTTKVINPPLVVYKVNNVLEYRGINGWYQGLTTKTIYSLSVPIIRRLRDDIDFTDSVYVRVAINGIFLFTHEITLAQINSAGLNDTTLETPDEEFMYFFEVPTFTINEGDDIYIGMSCKNPSDKLGYAYTDNASGEWGGLKSSELTVDILTLTTPPPEPVDPLFALPIWFYNEDYLQAKINASITPPTPPDPQEKQYLDVAYSRKAIGPFLEKLRLEQDVKIVCYGNSLTQFANSETLTVEEQKTNPIGLSGNSWVRQLWEMLNYDTTDLAFKRFDHADFTFSNGIQTTAAAIGANGWATNLNGSADTWRNEGADTVFAQSVMPSSSYTKPLVGTNKVGQTASVTVPATATSVDVVFIRPPLNRPVQIKINNGSFDIIDEVVYLNQDNTKPIEFRKNYTFASGTVKTITITNTEDALIWLWGIEYQSKPSVKVINSGRGGV